MEVVEASSRLNPDVDYTKSDRPFVVARFIVECSNKLKAKALTTSTALTLFHKYTLADPDPEYDPYLMAVSCLYVAGKVEDNHLRLRDLINVAHTTLRRDEDPMELNDEYYATREAIVQAELFLLRMVNFQTKFDHPHKYLLHYLKSLKEWMSDDVWEKYPIAKTSWSLLQDFYHDSSVVSLNKSLISLACIQLALQSYGIAVPYQGQKSWHFVFNETATDETLWEVMTKIMEVYTQDVGQIAPLLSSPSIASK